MLIDTNIILSFLLDQNDYKSTEKLFAKIDDLNISATIIDFAFYSVCLELCKRDEENYLKKFINYLKDRKHIRIYRPTYEDIFGAVEQKVKLDFDDKIHYYLAKKKNLTLISYDADFDKTDLKRLTPAEALKTLELS